MSENAQPQPLPTDLELLQQKLANLQAQLADFTRDVEFWQFSLEGIDAMHEGEEKQLMETKRQHFSGALEASKRERLTVQIWISSVERQIQALQQQ